MEQDDTIKLLRECSAGIQMGIHSIEEILPKAQIEEVRKILLTGLEKHQKLKQPQRRPGRAPRVGGPAGGRAAAELRQPAGQGAGCGAQSWWRSCQPQPVLAGDKPARGR